MCLGTFWRLRRSLAPSSLYAAVRILPEAFYYKGNCISFVIKNCKPHRLTAPLLSSCTFKTTYKFKSLLHPFFLTLSYLLGYALDRLVTVSSMHYCTSTSALSTLSSSRGLTTFVGISHLEGGFTLRCLQRLSLPDLATLPCSWRNNRYTSGQSSPVLSY